ncbi:MAG: dynamin [Verrucomicrobiales bacterium]|nr:dynamin [Verrucomicrobiales bacterium]
MVADEYFDLRSRLGAALFTLGRLCDLAGLKPSRAPLVKSLVEGLRDPFVFLVAGEVNAGKSTLLNALFGEVFCASGVLPETRRIHYFRYGKTPASRVVEGGVEEIELPLTFLRDFHIVDTPGVNSVESGHEDITGNFIPRADAVLFCFPATNPWSAAGWEFLEKVHADWLKKIVIVVQQSDLRTPEEMVAIADHLQAIAQARLGLEVPVIPVSGQLALMARTSGVDKVRLLAESRISELETVLTGMVADTAPRLGKLVSACSTGQAMLAEVQARISIAAAELDDLLRLRATAGSLGHAAAESLAGEAHQTAGNIRAAWENITLSHLSSALAARKGFPKMLSARDPTTETIESLLLPPLMQAARGAAGLLDAGAERVLAGLWEQPGSAIHRALEGKAGRPAEPDWAAGAGSFRTALETSVCQAVTGMGLRDFWSERLLHRSRLVRGVLLVGALGFGCLIAATATRGEAMGTGAFTLAGILLGGSILTIRRILKRETAETADLLNRILTDSGDRLGREVHALALDHSTARLAAFRTVTAPLDHVILTRQQASAPLEEETGQLALTLQGLARAFRH